MTLRHRYLESAGRWEEILDPALTVDVEDKPLATFDNSMLPS